MLKANAVLTATLQEKEYKRQFEKYFIISVADLFAKEFTGVDTVLSDTQKATVASLEQEFSVPSHKEGEVLKSSKVKDGDKELEQFEIADVIEFHVHPALRPAFHAINAKFDVEQRSIARAELEKELGIAKPRKTMKISDAVQKLAETLFQFKVAGADTMEKALVLATEKMGG